VKSNLIKPAQQMTPKTNNEGSTENFQRENSEKAKNNSQSKSLLDENKVKLIFDKFYYLFILTKKEKKTQKLFIIDKFF